MPKPAQIDLEEFLARAEAVTQVESHNKTWLAEGLAMIAEPTHDMQGWVGTGEDLRKKLTRLRRPGHPNAWGALIMQAVRKGLLIPTGRYLPMKDKSSHARKTPEYRRA